MATRKAATAGAVPPPPATPADTGLAIPRIAASHIRVPIVGTNSLIVNRWSEKAKRQMLDSQQGRKSPKQNRNPQADYEASMYRIDGGGYGFPVLGVKSSIVQAARYFGKDVKMTELRQFVFISGVQSVDRAQILMPIEGDEPKMREDMVTISRGGTDLRYRAEFLEWRAVVDVTFVTSALSRESLLALIDAAGLGVGIGEWRPEKSGDHGTFALDSDRELEVLS